MRTTFNISCRQAAAAFCCAKPKYLQIQMRLPPQAKEKVPEWVPFLLVEVTRFDDLQ